MIDIDDKIHIETTYDDDEDETRWTVVSYRRRNVRNNHQIEEPTTTGELTSQPEETTAEARLGARAGVTREGVSDTPSGNTEYGQNTSEHNWKLMNKMTFQEKGDLHAYEGNQPGWNTIKDSNILVRTNNYYI